MASLRFFHPDAAQLQNTAKYLCEGDETAAVSHAVYLSVPSVIYQRRNSSFSLGVAEVHSGGLILACTTVWRMGMLVSFTAILTFTTTPNKLAQGLEDVMKPLGWVGLSPRS
nr:CbiQ family ECF transporter T component [Paenibacillus larvae]